MCVTQVGNREEAISELQSVCGQHPNEFIAVFLLGKLMWSFSEEWRRDKTKCFSCFLKVQVPISVSKILLWVQCILSYNWSFSIMVSFKTKVVKDCIALLQNGKSAMFSSFISGLFFVVSVFYLQGRNVLKYLKSLFSNVCVAHNRVVDCVTPVDVSLPQCSASAHCVTTENGTWRKTSHARWLQSGLVSFCFPSEYCLIPQKWNSITLMAFGNFSKYCVRIRYLA